MGMPRAIWSGAIAFGMVVVPVKLAAATEEREGVKFHQVRKSDGSRINFRRIAAADGEEVPYSEIGKAFDWGGTDVLLTDEELASLPVPTLKQVQVLQFCRHEEVGAASLFGKTYYVVPDGKAAEHAYALLAYVLGHKVAVAKVALRQRESLCILYENQDGVIELTLLLWPEEVRESPVLSLPEPTPEEKGVAQQIVRLMTREFDPSEYRDAYAAAVTALAADKVANVKPAQQETPAAVVLGQATGLMEALYASVTAAKENKENAK